MEEKCNKRETVIKKKLRSANIVSGFRALYRSGRQRERKREQNRFYFRNHTTTF